ncbi:hypothetical protein C8J57DRAFT_1243271 [Mycena rebaudengoi]|nr:hypothetical protein C8J57DRAFT_1243271 [Mycena rebaudengoi]
MSARVLPAKSSMEIEPRRKQDAEVPNGKKRFQAAYEVKNAIDQSNVHAIVLVRVERAPATTPWYWAEDLATSQALDDTDFDYGLGDDSFWPEPEELLPAGI